MIRIYPAESSSDDLYSELLAGVPSGTQWHRSTFTLPLIEGTTSFILEGDVGDNVTIFIDSKEVLRTVLLSQRQQIQLQLTAGTNEIFARTTDSEFFIKVVATNYATFLKAFADEYFFNVHSKFEDAERQLNSELSLRAVEHQIGFQEMLPPTRAMRILAGKLAVRALINETATTRGVDDIVTAASNTTPVVRPTQVDLEFFDPAVLPVYSAAHDEGGFEFHVWHPNLCVGTWAAFIKLMDNLPRSIAELVSVSDERVVVNFMGTVESHSFDFDTRECSLLALITQDCLPIVVSVTTLVESEVAFCAWSYPFDTTVELALGRTRLDSILPYSESFSAVSIDTTGAVTGVLGAPYVTLANPVESVVSVSINDPAGTSFPPHYVVPGTSVLVLDVAPPSHPVVVQYRGLIAFDAGIPLDSCEEADPLCDGWFGTHLVDRFDSGSCLDTMHPDARLFEDLDCCFGRPASVGLGASLATIDVEVPISASATLLAP